jgi:hypothetical protein
MLAFNFCIFTGLCTPRAHLSFALIAPTVGPPMPDAASASSAISSAASAALTAASDGPACASAPLSSGSAAARAGAAGVQGMRELSLAWACIATDTDSPCSIQKCLNASRTQASRKPPAPRKGPPLAMQCTQCWFLD